jgi:hypothetical protein
MERKFSTFVRNFYVLKTLFVNILTQIISPDFLNRFFLSWQKRKSLNDGKSKIRVKKVPSIVNVCFGWMFVCYRKSAGRRKEEKKRERVGVLKRER